MASLFWVCLPFFILPLLARGGRSLVLISVLAAAPIILIFVDYAVCSSSSSCNVGFGVFAIIWAGIAGLVCLAGVVTRLVMFALPDKAWIAKAALPLLGLSVLAYLSFVQPVQEHRQEAKDCESYDYPVQIAEVTFWPGSSPSLAIRAKSPRRRTVYFTSKSSFSEFCATMAQSVSPFVASQIRLELEHFFEQKPHHRYSPSYDRYPSRYEPTCVGDNVSAWAATICSQSYLSRLGRSLRSIEVYEIDPFTTTRSLWRNAELKLTYPEFAAAQADVENGQSTVKVSQSGIAKEYEFWSDVSRYPDRFFVLDSITTGDGSPLTVSCASGLRCRTNYVLEGNLAIELRFKLSRLRTIDEALENLNLTGLEFVEQLKISKKQSSVVFQ